MVLTELILLNIGTLLSVICSGTALWFRVGKLEAKVDLNCKRLSKLNGLK